MRFAKFGLVGVSNTAVDFVVFNALHFLVGLPAVPANVVSYSTGILNSYIWNRGWAFADRRSDARHPEFVRFVLVNLGGLAVNTAIVWGLRTGYGAYVGEIGADARGVLVMNAIKGVAILGSLLWNYFGFGRWVFRSA